MSDDEIEAVSSTNIIEREESDEDADEKQDQEEPNAVVSRNFSRSSHFTVTVVGQIESGLFVDFTHIYVKYCFSYGSDWEVISGSEHGITQVAKRSADERQLFVWNFPIDLNFKSSNPFGWPQIVLSTYGFDTFGNDVPSGYGSAHIPPISGKHRLRVPLFVPKSSSITNQISAWFTGKRPEFVDPKVVANGEGRGVLSVSSLGFAFVEVNVILKDFAYHGYRTGTSSVNN